jgi:DNA-binding Lrp family transcriptional regulator
MKKMSVAEAAEFFGVSKEAVHNRIRRGSLKSVVEDGVKMVLVDENKRKRTTTKRTVKSTLNDERYYKLLEAQNAKLQERVEVLESETRSLRDQKEQMLIEERQKIERIYQEKDEQLKNILQTLSSKFMLGAPLQEEESIESDTIDVVEAETESNVISLKKYLKQFDFSKKKIEKIKKRFQKNEKKDERILVVGSKYYLDIAKYEYSDLVK